MNRGFKNYSEESFLHRKKIIDRLNFLARRFNFYSIETPVVASKKLFQKSLGSTSEIVNHQFFEIAGKENMVLRPELTSLVVANFFDSIFWKQRNKKSFYTHGPCFRYERPQKGRYRQFLQWNLESFLTDESDLFLIFRFLYSIIVDFNLIDKLVLKINFLNPNYFGVVSNKLLESLDSDALCELCALRFKKKRIFRILDCKECTLKIKKTVTLFDFLSKEEKQKLENTKEKIKTLMKGVEVVIDLNLIRGLDYYSGFVFELFPKNSTNLAQGAILAGGEYFLSSFSEKKESENTKGIGFAIGIERLISSLLEGEFFRQKTKDLNSIIIAFNEKNLLNSQIFDLERKLIFLGFKIIMIEEPTTFLKALKKADKKKSKFLIFFGEEFESKKEILLRFLDDKKEKSQKIFKSNDDTLFFLKEWQKQSQ